jgi:hypothetical protein
MEDPEDYRKRMLRQCRQFSFFGIQPAWRPGEGDVEGFCHDEVVRQWHDPRDGNRAEGGMLRIEWMLDAWRYAEGVAGRHVVIAMGNVLDIGAMIEPDYNAGAAGGEFRHENVYIGDRMGVYPPFLRETMEQLLKRAGDVVPGEASSGLVNEFSIEGVATGQFEELVHTVDEWYLGFEWIHPFRDGNGRTGKILHNWLNGTLDEPVLVQDYFGGGNP